MGLDLTIIPYMYGNEEHMKRNRLPILGYSRMSFQRNYALFAHFTDMSKEYPKPTIITKELPLSVYMYQDEGIKEITTDTYGVKLRYALAEEFNKIDMKIFNNYHADSWNKAIIEMVKHLPPDTPIILYWH